LTADTGPIRDQYALILGASSGFGAACALELACAGMHILGVHLDRKPTMPAAEKLIEEIRASGRRAEFFNVNAADMEKRTGVLDELQASVPEFGIRLLVHSLAFGSVGPLVDCVGGDCVEQRGLEMTLDVMANSLIYWSRGLVERKLLGPGGRIVAMTSAGDSRVWRSYGAVSAAKSALEAHVRQLAVELAPIGVTANALRAGVTDTPALRKIPENALMVQKALARNPSGRLTVPKDVADAVVLLADPRSQWITGNVIGVDGGEFITD
jgi:enoyl-[acyl-carrier protein] reductase III